MRSQADLRKLTAAAVLTALALALSLIDTAVSSVLPFLPGMKIGLAGGVTVFALCAFEKKYVILIVAARVLLAGAFAGTVTSMMFSLAGAFLSLGIMVILHNRVSTVKMSVAGGVAHNIAQVIVAIIVSGTAAVSWYFPYLAISGTISGFLMGMLATVLLKRVGRSLKH